MHDKIWSVDPHDSTRVVWIDSTMARPVMHTVCRIGDWHPYSAEDGAYVGYVALCKRIAKSIAEDHNKNLKLSPESVDNIV